MLKIGLVDIETTHAWIYAQYLKATGDALISTITDMGNVWQPKEIKRFAEALGGVNICKSPEGMVGMVDGVMLLGTNYDMRLERAKPFLEAKIPIFFDKPAVGKISDLKILKKWVDSGARIMCGSSLPYCDELRIIYSRVTSGPPCSLYIIGCKEFFEHGIHAADIAMALSKAEPIEVIWGIFGGCDMLWVRTSSYTDIALQLGANGADWIVSATNGEGSSCVHLDLSHYRESHYAHLTKAFLDMVRTGRVIYSPNLHLDAIRLLIAGKKAKEKNKNVLISSLDDEDGFNGKAYSRRYAQMSVNFQNMLQPSLKDMIKKKKVGKRRNLFRHLEMRVSSLPLPAVIRKPLRFIKYHLIK